MINLGNRLKAARILLGMSGVELAEEMGVSQSQVSNIELGRNTNPTIGTLSKICKSLGVSLKIDWNAKRFPCTDEHARLASMSLDEYLLSIYNKLSPTKKDRFGRLNSPQFYGRALITHYSAEHKTAVVTCVLHGVEVDPRNSRDYGL